MKALTKILVFGFLFISTLLAQDISILSSHVPFGDISKYDSLNKPNKPISPDNTTTGLAHLVNILTGGPINGKNPYLVMNSNWEGTIYFPAGNPTSLSGWGITFRLRADLPGKYSLEIMNEPPSPWNPFFRTAIYNESYYYQLDNAITQDIDMGVAVPSYSAAPSTQMKVQVQEYGIVWDTGLRDYLYNLRTDGDAPSSSVSAFLPSSQNSATINVVWSGSDGTAATSSGLKKYDLQVRIDNGSWQDWITGTSSTSGSYPGSAGHTYYFQTRAYDNVGNTETYPGGNGDAWVYVNKSFSITSSAGSGGSISPSGVTNVYENSSQAYTITPNTGYQVDYVTVDGVSQGAITSYTFSNVTAAHSINAYFRIKQYTITSSAGSGGTITPSGNTSVNHGSNQTYTITPNTGYQVDYVTVDGVSQGAITSYTFSNVTAAHSISANFKSTSSTTQQITIATSPSGRSIIVDGTTYTAPQTFTWSVGSSHSVNTTSPQSGGTGVQYVYSSWSDGGAQSHNYTVPSSNSTLTANFTTQYYLTVSSVYGTPSGQGWHNSGATAYAGLNTGTVSGTTGTQYIFSSWGTDASGSNHAQSNAITMTGAKTATANWNTQYYLTMNAGTGGTVTPSSGWYNSGTTGVQIQANPSAGYAFSSWSGSGTGSYTGTSNPATVTMNAPITESASFIVAPSIKPISDATSYFKGTEFWVKVKVGDPNVVTDLYGVSFKLKSDNALCTYVDGSAAVETFLGASPLPFFQKVDNQTVDIAVTKTSSPGVDGSGFVAKAKFIGSSSITSDQTVNFSLVDVTATNSSGGTIVLGPGTLSVQIQNGLSVWPGDCDNSGVVTGADLLPIGLYYGQQWQNYPTANNPGSVWQAYIRQPWNNDVNPPKKIYADANGSGKIDGADVLAIGLNYGKTHSIAIPVTEHPVVEYANSVDKIILSVKRVNGNRINVKMQSEFASELYGLSMKLHGHLVRNGIQLNTLLAYKDIDTTNSVMGSTIQFVRAVKEKNIVDIGLSRIDGKGVAGIGQIVSLQYELPMDYNVSDQLVIHPEDVLAIDAQGNTIPVKIIDYTGNITSVSPENNVPTSVVLEQNYPNPFNPSTTIRYALIEDSKVRLEVFDLLGREIALLVNDVQDAGYHQVDFSSTEHGFSKLPSGVYIYRFTASSLSSHTNAVLTKRMILNK